MFQANWGGHARAGGGLSELRRPSVEDNIVSRAHTASHRTHERNETISRLDSPPNLRSESIVALFNNAPESRIGKLAKMMQGGNPQLAGIGQRQPQCTIGRSINNPDGRGKSSHWPLGRAIPAPLRENPQQHHCVANVGGAQSVLASPGAQSRGVQMVGLPTHWLT